MRMTTNGIRKGWMIVVGIVLLSCTERPEKALYGSWRVLDSGNVEVVQGVTLAKNGVAKSFGNPTLRYDRWQWKDFQLILEGASLMDGQELPFSDTLSILSQQADTLIVGREAAYRTVYVRQPDGRESMVLPSLTGEPPLRLLFEPDSTTVQLWFSSERVYALARAVRPDGTSVWSGSDDDSLQVEKYKGVWQLARNGKPFYVESDEGYDRPSRPAYDGFHWDYLSGAGMGCWVQGNAMTRLRIDPALPGIVVIREEEPAPRPVIRVFDLPDGRLETLLAQLAREPGWKRDETARFQEQACEQPGVRRFVLVPEGAYARRMDSLMQRESVPVTCSGWGVGNDGMRYFEIREDHPHQALFMEIGSEAPLFDERSFRWEPTPERADPRDVLRRVSGTLCIGHEVRSLTLDDGSGAYWVVDRTGTLEAAYAAWTDGEKNGKPLPVQLCVEYDGKWLEGFAAEYDGVFLVREVLRLGPAK